MAHNRLRVSVITALNGMYCTFAVYSFSICDDFSVHPIEFVLVLHSPGCLLSELSEDDVNWYGAQ